MNDVLIAQEYFKSRDEADARELERDLKQAIASAIISEKKRLWVLTNANTTVVDLALININKDKRELDNHGLQLKIYNPELSTIKPGVKNEIALRWQATIDDIPTMIVEVEISSKKVHIIEK